MIPERSHADIIILQPDQRQRRLNSLLEEDRPNDLFHRYSILLLLLLWFVDPVLLEEAGGVDEVEEEGEDPVHRERGEDGSEFVRESWNYIEATAASVSDCRTAKEFRNARTEGNGRTDSKEWRSRKMSARSRSWRRGEAGLTTAVGESREKPVWKCASNEVECRQRFQPFLEKQRIDWDRENI